MSNIGNYVLDKATADAYISGWKSGEYSIVPSSVPVPTAGVLQLDSFVFNFGDFQDFVNQVNASKEDVTGVVCRIGIKPNPIAGMLPPMVPALVFEAVLKFDPTSVPQAGNSTGELGGLSDRYDFSYPCPPTCPQQ